VRKEGNSDFSGATTPMHGLNATIGYQNGFKQYGKNAQESKKEQGKITLDDE
jgi:hypothetical protein